MLITLEALHYYTTIIRSHTSELQPFKHRDLDSISTWIPNWTSEFVQESQWQRSSTSWGWQVLTEKSGWPVLLM